MQKWLIFGGFLAILLLIPVYGSDPEVVSEQLPAPLASVYTATNSEPIDVEAEPETALSASSSAASSTERATGRVTLTERDKVLQPGTDTVSPKTSLLKIVISLALVVTLVIVLGWLFKKMSLRMPGSRQIKIISALPLGQRERILVIEIQGKQRVLGVTPHSINLLFELENPLPDEKLASDFHTQLQSFLKK